MNRIQSILFTILLLLLLVLGNGCNPNNSQKADLVLRNGLVYTVDSLNSKAEAVAVKDGKIVFVGDNDAS